jgi:protein O-mannosyl-transferase
MKTKPTKIKEIENIKSKSSILLENKKSNKWLYAIVLALIAFVVFTNTNNGAFTLDDPGIINSNKITKEQFSFSNTITIFSTSYRDGLLGNFENTLYRPFVKLCFNILYNISGEDTFAYHLLNILLYCLISILIFIVVSKIFKNNLIAFLSSLIFIVHPIHSEVVANVKGLEELISFTGLLATIYFAFQYDEEGKNKSLMFCILGFCIALFSKESSVLGIILVPLCLFFANKNMWNKKIMLGLGLSIIFFLICRHFALSHYDSIKATASKLDNILYFAVDENKNTNWAMRFGTAFYLQGFALFKLLWPTALSCDYNFAAITPKTFANYEAWLGLAFYIGLIVLTIKSYRKNKIISFGISWYLLASLLTNNIFMVIGSSFADRLLFVPSFGLLLAIIATVASLLKFDFNTIVEENLINSISKNKLLSAIIFALCIPLAVLSYNRNADWQNNMTLYSADLNKYPDLIKMQRSLAQSLTLQVSNNCSSADSVVTNSLLAIKYFKNAYKLFPEFRPDDWNFYGLSYYNLFQANVSNSNVCLDSAQYLFKMAHNTGYKPESCEVDLSRIYTLKYQKDNSNKSQLDSAMYYGEIAYNKNPNDIVITQNIGALYGMDGKIELGIEWLQKAWAIDNTSKANINTASNLGKLYEMLGKQDLAKDWLAKAQKLAEK